MITFNDIKKNNEIYNNANAYVDTKNGISSNLKKEIKYVIEKYRHYFCVMEEKNLKRLIDKSVDSSDIRILKNSLHSIGGFNYSASRDYYDDKDQYDRGDEDDEYNLD